MKIKEKTQIKGKTIAEIKNDIVKAKDDLRSLLLDKSQGKVKNTSSLSRKRKEIAILLTVMREKEMSEEGDLL